MSKEEDKKHQDFYNSLNPDLASYFDENASDMSPSMLEFAYPLQNELKDLPERYTEKELIGEGGMKLVYKVKDNYTSRYVAMAVLRENPTKDEIERFLQEARLASNLQHPNIIRVYNLGINEQGLPFFTMELLHGETLGSVIKKLTENDESYKTQYHTSALLDIFLKICDAMSFAHSRNILHLDLKPENIHIGKYGEVRVCDWGIARVLNEEAEQEQEEDLLDPDIINDTNNPDLIKGTPGFMSSEQCSDTQKKSKLSDIYALGSILYCMLTYTIPVEGADHHQMIDNTKEGNLIPAGERNPLRKISPRLESIAMKALAHSPERRYQSVSTLESDVRNYIQGFAIMAEENNILTQIALILKRHKTISALSAIFLAIIISVTTVSFININKNRNSAVVSQKRAEKSLHLLRKETLLTHSLNTEIEELLSQNALNSDLSNARSKIKLLKTGLKKEIAPAKKQIIIQKKALLHFVLQEFNQAYECLEQTENPKPKNLFNIIATESKIHKELKKDKELLNEPELAALIGNLGGMNKAIALVMYNNHMDRKRSTKIDPEEYFPLARVMMQFINFSHKVGLDRRNFKKTEKGYSLDLSGSSFYTCKSKEGRNRNVLAPLQLHYLDISHSAFFFFSTLTGMKVDKINITGTKLTKIDETSTRWLQTMGVKEIILAPKDYDASSLSLLKKNFIVTNQRALK